MIINNTAKNCQEKSYSTANSIECKNEYVIIIETSYNLNEDTWIIGLKNCQIKFDWTRASIYNNDVKQNK